MIFRTLDALEQLGRIKYPADESFRSGRFITAMDGFGISYNENRVRQGVSLDVWLKHHWEANYIVSGSGQVSDLTRGDSWPLKAGLLYVVGPNDRHRLDFTEDECHISVFCPPLTGNEGFDEDGAYQPSGPIQPTDRRMFARHADDIAVETHLSQQPGTVLSIPLLTVDDAIGFEMRLYKLSAGSEISVGQTGHQTANHMIHGTGA